MFVYGKNTKTLMKLGKEINQHVIFSMTWHRYIPNHTKFFILVRIKTTENISANVHEHLGVKFIQYENEICKFILNEKWVFCFHMTYITLILKCNGVFLVNKYRRFMVIGNIITYVMRVTDSKLCFSLIRFVEGNHKSAFLIKYCSYITFCFFLLHARLTFSSLSDYDFWCSSERFDVGSDLEFCKVCNQYSQKFVSFI